MTSADRKRELKQRAAEYKPQMGVVSFTWQPTGEVFLAAASNVPAFLNRTPMQAETGTLRNKRFQQLWNEHDEKSMTYTLVEELDYQDGVDDYTDDLKVLLAACLEAHPTAQEL